MRASRHFLAQVGLGARLFRLHAFAALLVFDEIPVVESLWKGTGERHRVGVRSRAVVRCTCVVEVR